MCSDAAKGVDARECSDGRVILDSNVPAQRGGIRQDDVAPDDAVVSDVYVHHEEIVIANLRMSAAPLCSPMDIHELAKYVMGTDCQECLFAFELEILRWKSDGPEREEMIVITDRRRTFDDHVGIESAATPDVNPAPDATIRPNENVGSHPGFWTDDGRGMDHGK